jgi:xanthine dehydrogenase accessory factor
MLLSHEGITKVTMAPTRNQVVVEDDPERISSEMLNAALESAMAGNMASTGVSGSAVDPVCGMSVKTDTTTLHSDHNGQRYYFCTPSCKHAFEDDPSLFEDTALRE